MLKKITALAASALLLAGLTGCSLTKRELVDVTYDLEVPPKVVFLGDSIAAGYGLDGYTSGDNYSCRSYANILHERYSAELADVCDHQMQNFAVSGATSADLLELLNSGKLDSALANSDAVVVSIGGNDLLHNILGVIEELGVTAENGRLNLDDVNIFAAAGALLTMDSDVDKALDGFEVNLQEISAALNEKTDGTIYIQTLYDPLEVFTDYQMVVDFSEKKLGRFNEIVKSNAPESYTVIDIADTFDGKCGDLTRIAALDIHPNEKGHEVIADTIDSAFRNTGFTYVGQAYSEPHLTALAYGLIIGAIALMLIMLIYISRMYRKNEGDDKNEGSKSEKG